MGLGNPGPEYANHRHNVGFMTVDLLARRHNISFRRTRWRGQAGSGSIDGARVDLLKPMTFMNESGFAVRGYASFTNASITSIVVIHDDLDLPLGRLRFRESGSAGGNRGVRSIIDHLRTDNFHRLKLGIGRPPEPISSASYVLSPFAPSERESAAAMIERAADAIELFVREGPTAAANQYNRS